LKTNKTLLKVTPLAPLHDLINRAYPDRPSDTLEEFSSRPGYYLIDAPTEVGWQALILERELRKVSERIFRQELCELSIPPDIWPSVDDFDVFRGHIKVETLALIADLGDAQIETTELPDTL